VGFGSWEERENLEFSDVVGIEGGHYEYDFGGFVRVRWWCLCEVMSCGSTRQHIGVRRIQAPESRGRGGKFLGAGAGAGLRYLTFDV